MNMKDRTELEQFWEEQAKKLPWFSPWDKVLDWQEPSARWFVGGTLNVSYLCLDRHIEAGLTDKIAIYWHNEQGESRTVTYGELYSQVNKLAHIFAQMGITSADNVILYMPLIPEATATMLALGRIGATLSVVFSGFSAPALRDRIEDAQARFIITADYTWRRGKKIKLKDIVDQALEKDLPIERVLVFQREDNTCMLENNGRYVIINRLLAQLPNSTYVKPVPVESNHLLFILYTSGTTGKPKGIMHGTGGYLTYIYFVFKHVFDITHSDIYWCTADIGWITGHSFVVYAPLMHGISSVMYEGAPDYPDIQVWWKLIEQYRVSLFYTSPTALRMFMRHDNGQISRHDLSSLRVLGSVGEPINPEVWHWYFRTIGQGKCPIMDTWWQTETGGFMISNTVTHVQNNRNELKAGSAGKPLPYIKAAIVDEHGTLVPVDTKGFLVIKQPWPGLTLGIYGDRERFKDVYWSKFPGSFYTGDFARQDQDGDFWLLGRADEVLSLAGHRVGTAEIESAVIIHEFVAEAAVIGIPDEIKGEVVVIFITLRAHASRHHNLKDELIALVRNHIGPFVTPKDIYFVEKLPKTRSGKIMRRVLKAIAHNQPIGDLSTLEDEASVAETVSIVEAVTKLITKTDIID